LTAALAQPGAQASTATRARALAHLANLVYQQSDYPAMRSPAEEALTIWRELGQAGRSGTALVLDLLGELATEEGDYDRAPALYEEAMRLYRVINDVVGIGITHMQLGWAADADW